MVGATGEDFRLEAAEGLALVLEAGGRWRVEWRHRDWLGPLGLRVRHAGRTFSGPLAQPSHVALQPTLRPFESEDDLGAFRGVEIDWAPTPLRARTSVRACVGRPLLVFRVEADAPLEDLATGAFDEPSLAWPWLQPAERMPDGLPGDARAFGHGYSEFALPTHSDASLAGFGLLPFRPAVVEPLWLMAPDAGCLLLAPLGAFHDQVIAVPRGVARAAEGVRCGWHGDLEGVPRGFATEWALWAGPGPRRVLEDYAALLRARHSTRRLSRHADATLARLSYWTDNGAAYWYRSEPGLDVGATLERTADGLRSARVPVCAFELDSWFYPHQITRAVGPVEPVPGEPAPPHDVPPTGALRWEPREDLLPDGLGALRARLGDPPLVLHARHFSSRSRYFERHAAWIDGDRAHPVEPDLLHALVAQAAAWGAVTYEQDWLVECFLGVRGLRARPGRARAWQEALDEAAAEHGVSLLWCMATPADFLQTLTLRHVAAIRTSGDYRYLLGNASLWVWLLYGNALARALGLHAFKDVFLSCRDGTGLDGDPHAEAEALLAVLSAGPVGIGDRAGRTDRDLVLRTCREDGVLVKPDAPVAALERCFGTNPFLAPEPLLGETLSAHPAGRWIYLVAMNAFRERRRLDFRVALSDLGTLAPQAPVVAWDWRRRRWARLGPRDGLDFSLEPLDWDLRVLCPLLPGGVALFGDVSRYACAGDRRVRGIRSLQGRGVELEVLAAAGERVEIHGLALQPVENVETWTPEGVAEVSWRQAEDGVFSFEVTPGERGWVRARVVTRDEREGT